MNVESRIEQEQACAVINLTASEKDIYTGPGWKLARFIGGGLAGFFDPMHIEYKGDVDSMIKDILDAATAWIANAEGEVWLVLCSSHQLCMPVRISLTDADSLDRMARVFGEEINALFE